MRVMKALQEQQKKRVEEEASKRVKRLKELQQWKADALKQAKVMTDREAASLARFQKSQRIIEVNRNKGQALEVAVTTLERTKGKDRMTKLQKLMKVTKMKDTRVGAIPWHALNLTRREVQQKAMRVIACRSIPSMTTQDSTYTRLVAAAQADKQARVADVQRLTQAIQNIAALVAKGHLS